MQPGDQILGSDFCMRLPWRIGLVHSTRRGYDAPLKDMEQDEPGRHARTALMTLTTMHPLKPDFLIVGAAKCGTTALSAYLKQHPCIFMPSIKEPRYFAADILRATSRLDPQFDYLQRSSVLTREGYYDLFKNSRDYQVRGESSVHYLFHYRRVIPNIIRELGDVKIIILLRNPAIRALSNYYYLPKETLPLQKALDAEKERRERGFNSFWYYKDQGLYYAPVKAYLDRFSNVKVIFSRDFRARPRRVCREVFDFLGVASDVAIDPAIDANPTQVPKSNFHRFLLRFEHTPPVQKVLLPLFGDRLREYKQNWLKRPDYYRDLHIYNRLVDCFVEDIGQLEQLLSRNLDHWKEKK
jgi:hypothetical protein